LAAEVTETPTFINSSSESLVRSSAGGFCCAAAGAMVARTARKGEHAKIHDVWTCNADENACAAGAPAATATASKVLKLNPR